MIQLTYYIIRARHSHLLFRKIYRVMVCDMMEVSIIWLNNISPKGVISEHISPKIIITGTPLDYEKQCNFYFGVYAQVVYEN